MTEENGVIRLILALVFLNAAMCIPRSSYSAPAMQISNTTSQFPSNYTTVIDSAKRDHKHEPLDQLAQEQRLALQIITTDSGDSGGSSENNNNISPSGSAKRHKESESNNSGNGAISFDDQYNHMEAQLKRDHELNSASGEKLKRIVINLDSLMTNGTNLPHGKGTKLTIGFSPAKAAEVPKQNINPKQHSQGSSREVNNDKSDSKNSLIKSTSKKKEVPSSSSNSKKAQAGEAQGGGAGGTMRGGIREAVRRQGGIPTMVMSEIEFGSGGVEGEPRLKFMVNSEAIDLMHRQGANNIHEVARPLQSSESVISDASLQEAIDTLSGEIESLEKQLDGGVNERFMVRQGDNNNDGNIVIDVSSSNNNNRHQPSGQQDPLVGRERDARHMLPAPLSATTETSVDGNRYYGQTTGRTQPAGQDDGQATHDDSDENYGLSGQRTRADNNQDENDDDGENRERSNESENLEVFGDKSANLMGRDSHVSRQHSNGVGEENDDSRNYHRNNNHNNNDNNNNNNNNDDNNNDDSIQNYETRASDKLPGEKLESMNNPTSTHRLHESEGFTVSSNLFNEQIEPTAQQVDYYENKSNDMSASVAPDGSAPNPTTNDSSSATKKLAKQKQQQQQQQQKMQPTIESENKMEERVARILDRLKLYTTKDQLMKVAQDLQNNYPDSARESDGSKNAALDSDFGAINRSGQQMQQQKNPRFVKRNHLVSLMDSLRMPQQRSGPWPMRAGLNVEEDFMNEMEMARKQIPASLHGSNYNIESLLTSATSSSGGDPEARGSTAQVVQDSTDNRRGTRYGGAIEERKRKLENGIKLLNEFRTRQIRLKSMEDSLNQNAETSVEPMAAHQQGNIVLKRDRVNGNAEEYDSESAHQGKMDNFPDKHNQGAEEPEAGGSYEVTGQQVIAESSGGTKEYETTKDLVDTMENNEKTFENENQRADGSRKSRRYIVNTGDDYSIQNNNFNDGGSEASESNQQESIGTMDQKSEALRREGEAELKALEQIIDELMRRERKDKQKRDLANQ